MKKISILFCIVLLSLTACNKAAKEEKQDAAALYAESMKIHDAIMPRMDALFTLRQKLSQKLDSLKTDSISNAAFIADVRKGIADLVRADEGMMDWMHNVKDVPGAEATSAHHHGSHDAPAENLSEEEALKVQQQQKEAIEKVRTEMEESMENAKRLLDKK